VGRKTRKRNRQGRETRQINKTTWKKKVGWQTSLGKIEILQNCFLNKRKRGINKKRYKPFEELSGIKNRSFSKRCQKLMTDFGIEESFQQAANRMKEHHGVEVNASSIRQITLMHAKRAETLVTEVDPKNRTSKQMVLEMDGEMVPLVKYEDGAPDKRKAKKNFWAELRLGVVQNHLEAEWKYVASFKSPDELGERLQAIMKRIGLNENTLVHGVGDGALWIPEQGEKIAAHKYHHLIDLYHLCDYLADAVKAWVEETKVEVDRLKSLFEEGKVQEVLKFLKSKLEEFKDHEGLKACIQYIENRPGQFEYKAAKEKELPLGSGKVESSHRHVIQKRLKKSGTWWLRENAAKMADLRTIRANGCWEKLWQQNSETKGLQCAA
jgi:hypothetical protein